MCRGLIRSSGKLAIVCGRQTSQAEGLVQVTGRELLAAEGDARSMGIMWGNTAALFELPLVWPRSWRPLPAKVPLNHISGLDMPEDCLLQELEAIASQIGGRDQHLFGVGDGLQQ